MSFDRLAPHYHWLELAFAGGLMHRCRTAFLPRTRAARHALLVGEGTGRFLAELLRANPHVRVTCVEHSPAMIEQARRRLHTENLDPARVEFHAANALDWSPPAGQYDLLVTNFFLDCFRPAQLQDLVPRLARATAPGALWLLADFRVPPRGWRRLRAIVILAALYAGFKITTSLSASRLTPPDPLLAQAGFSLVERRLASFGLAHSDLWQRTLS